MDKLVVPCLSVVLITAALMELTKPREPEPRPWPVKLEQASSQPEVLKVGEVVLINSNGAVVSHVPEGMPSAAVTIGGGIRSVLAHFVDKDGYLLVGKGRGVFAFMFTFRDNQIKVVHLVAGN